MSHHRFQLPRTDGTWLFDPPARGWTEIFEANHLAVSNVVVDCQGRSLTELRQLTQRHVAQLASAYTSNLLDDSVPRVEPQRWIVTGHQPELFHPGVWVKNFAVHRLARQTGAVGLNLIVDQDTHPGAGITIPAGDRHAPSLKTIDFDAAGPTRPWEEQGLTDPALFETFDGRVAEALRPWGISPLLSDAWPMARRYARQTGRPRLCDCLSAMRTGVERRWQAGNLELPMSQLSASPGFYWFTAHILAQLPRFRTLYNTIVGDYRRRHRLRSRTHPVPDLAEQDEWLESPFWVWRAGDLQRDRLFARQLDGEILLRDSRDVLLRLPLTPDRSACCTVEQLATLPGRGIRLRSRALTTTLFARLFLADLFVHGIGGAKYDEMTDELIPSFYGLTAPGYGTISATAYLPLGGGFDVTAEDLGRTAHQLWDTEHSPERFLPDPDEPAKELIEEKSGLIAEQKTWELSGKPHGSALVRAENRTRHLRLREINAMLRSGAQQARHDILDRQQRIASQLKANRILRSRNFSWVLYPEEQLHAFIKSMPITSPS